MKGMSENNITSIEVYKYIRRNLRRNVSYCDSAEYAYTLCTYLNIFIFICVTNFNCRYNIILSIVNTKTGMTGSRIEKKLRSCNKNINEHENEY